MPSALLPGTPADTTQIAALIALCAAAFTFVEYNSTYPSLVEFRDAPPFNRIRFFALFAAVMALTVIARGKVEPSTMTRLFDLLGARIAEMLDFPYSPVRLVVLMMPRDADPALVESVRTAAGLSYLVSIISLAAFVLILRIKGWPRSNSSFNVWTNLPTFDPTTGGDVVARLTRDGQINIILGFLLPFVIPAFIKLTSEIFNPISLANPHTLIWTMAAWAFLPSSLLMRGIAMGRVAQMIQDKRRRSYAEAHGLQPV
ncbi:hypothetical protein [Limimaricola sp.]|uniref:hypothetical protein n=1 Tax=Limimaricola sp. TaxID=2211665 RepID=UPI0025BA51B7|nr:hypothetical protein [Limimaricola sp.]